MNGLARQIPFEEAAYGSSEAFFDDLTQFMMNGESQAMTHSNLERELEEKGRELMRLLLQEHLDKRAEQETEITVTDTEGEERNITKIHDRKLETVFGTVEVNRIGYGREGTDSLHPMDAELNLPDERYSLELRRRVAMEISKSSFDETIDHITHTTGGHIPKRQVQELAQRAAKDFDSFYAQRQLAASTMQDSSDILVMSADGKGVTMLTQDLREQTRKAAEERTNKMTKRLSKGEKRNAKRMSTVATVYTIAPHKREPKNIVGDKRYTVVDHCPPKPENKRVWASLEKSPAEVIEEVFNEASSRDPMRQKTWVALVDGNKHQLAILKRLAKEKGLQLMIILDIIHVIEYLWLAGRVFHPKPGLKLELWVQERILKVLEGKSGLVAGGMRRSATQRKWDEEKREPIDKCATYLLNNKPYLQYSEALSKGVPIATGVIEGACRHLVRDRMDVTGARWSLIGAEAVLKLRALRSSKDFDEYWEYHEKCHYERVHENRFYNGNVSGSFEKKKISKCQHLRIVK